MKWISASVPYESLLFVHMYSLRESEYLQSLRSIMSTIDNYNTKNRFWNHVINPCYISFCQNFSQHPPPWNFKWTVRLYSIRQHDDSITWKWNSVKIIEMSVRYSNISFSNLQFTCWYFQFTEISMKIYSVLLLSIRIKYIHN